MARRVHIDCHVAMNTRHFLFSPFFYKNTPGLTGEYLGIFRNIVDFVPASNKPIGHSPDIVFHIVHRTIIPNPLQFFIGHSIGIGFGVN